MLIKLLGAACIVIATTKIGLDKARAVRERPKQLRLLKTALKSLEAEIMYGHTPLPIICNHLSKQLEGPVGVMFERFASELTEGNLLVEDAWKRSLDSIWNKTYLKKPEYEIMLQFGSTIGRHDKYTEQKQIMLALNHLEREEQEAFELQGKYEKMYVNLGFLSGLLIALLFV